MTIMLNSSFLRIGRREGRSFCLAQSLRLSSFQFGLAMPRSFSRVCTRFKLRSIDEVAPTFMAI